MTTKQIDYLGSNTIMYRDTRAIERVGAIWGTELDLPRGYADLQGALEAVGALRATQPPTLTALAMDGAPSTLAKRIEKHAPAYAAWTLIEAQQGQAKQQLTDRMKREMESPATLDYLLDQLPLTEVEAQFTNAIDSLGQSVYSLSAAVDRDAEAVADLRESGRKLASLQFLMNRNDNIYSSAIYADIDGDFETLYYSKDGFGRIERHYDQAQLDMHQSLASLRNTGLDLGSVFTAVALGAKPGVKFSLAKSHAELRERSQRMKQAGKTNQINHA